MPYRYPAISTGTAQDLLSIVTRANERYLEKNGTVLPVKTPLARAFLEPPFLAIGRLVAWIFERTNPERALKQHDKLFQFLARPYHYPFNPDAPALAQARELVQKTANAGKHPALLALISHPPVLGDLGHMNLELVRHAMLALRQTRGAPCRPRVMVAVDPFALDTLPMIQEGLYAGAMSSYHLGLDRMALGRSRAVRIILKNASWTRLPARLIKLLNQGREVGMVLAGGVPSTARPLYALREWLILWRRRSPRRGEPAEVLRRLKQFPGFARFMAEWPHGPALERSAWKMMEAWAMSALEGSEDPYDAAALTGRLDGPAHDILDRCLEALGFEQPERITALAALRGALARETPSRGRFFRVLADRVLASGRPIVFIPVAHQIAPGTPRGVIIKPAWAWVRGNAGKLEGLRAGPKISPWSGSAGAFASAFVAENFA